ncbi:insulin-like growth factor-binding protein complex acid labile subunit [Eupeodes corollae]|uniref:insulin-like growth factor-binding protein complex acid labile subunit n=1 Tax=Eupeodes corollae TaxID=290404 RepID=UPI00248F6171|nr:insulin-like growth factor-binding protein complex acid labile subunit [Eupeodes corollae]XP_055920159.1 insulin-like growth factor-binding protein complex acid labile subunit [Eupeodes corollae]
MDLRIIILQISYIIIFAKMLAFGFISQDERKCKYLKVDRLTKVKCFDMNLREVPQFLSTSVEVLDLAFNRIKKLKRHSFKRYGKIKYLLLYENMIQSVEPETFAHLSSLQEIDLSNNALLTIPLEIFQLPSLRNLYVDSNDLINLNNDLKRLEKPIQAPLEYFNVAECGLQDLPDIGIVPYLWQINASSNPLKEITTETLATMCNLKSIDLLKTQMPICACHQILDYINIRKIKNTFLPMCQIPVGAELDECPPLYNITVGLPEYEQCNQATLSAAAKSTWLTIAGCLSGVFLVLLILLYCIRRRKRRKEKKKEMKREKKRFINPTTATTTNNIIQQDECMICDTA